MPTPSIAMPALTRSASLGVQRSEPMISQEESPLRKLRVLVLTFNMNRKQQIFEMNKLFPDPSQYDMIIVGGQEAKMTQKTSIIIEFANYLGTFEFITINSVAMWEMFLVGFVRVGHVPALKNVQISYVAAGMGGVLGNKGGLQMSFRLYDYLYNFVNVHLIHGAKRLDKRNEMMADLLRKMRNQREELDPDMVADYAFILGDMNYRMDGDYDTLVAQMDKIVGLRKGLD